MMTIFAVAMFLAGTPADLGPDAPVDPRWTKETLPLVFTVVDTSGSVLDMDVSETETEIRIDLAADVLFEFDKADLQPKAQEGIAQVAEVLRGKAQSVRIEGHTDGRGAAAYNQKLSEKRARAVAEALKGSGGLEGVRLEPRGFGATRPIAPNVHADGSDDPEGRQKNRRVEIVARKKG